MLRFAFYFLLASLIIGIFFTVYVASYLLPNLPDISDLKHVKMQVPLRIYSSELSLIAEFGEKRRIPIYPDQIPKNMIRAFIAAEDDRFYEHPGVDWQGLMRALYIRIKTGRKKQGGSTITMQVARNLYLTSEKTYTRKLNEILLAFKIENQLSKDEIITLYINKIFFGQRAYGVAAAAQVYYGSSTDDLSLAQIAMIAGLPQSPSASNPVANPEKALARRGYVLNRMYSLGFINQAEFETAQAAPITASLHKTNVEIKAPYVAEMIRQKLNRDMGDRIYHDGFNVITTILNNHQIAANQALRDALISYDKRHGYRGPESQVKDISTPDQSLVPFKVINHLYPALVTKVNQQSVIAYMVGIGSVEIPWEGLKWARPYINETSRGAQPKNATDILNIGDIIRLTETDKGFWQLAQIPVVQGGLLSLDPEDGAVLAMIGGFDYGLSKFNRVTQAKRQPGSAFKPFIYSAALEAGKTAATLINDAPIFFSDPSMKDWRPKNYDLKTQGLTRIREALTKSKNLVSIRLLKSIGIDFAIPHIKQFGINVNVRNFSLALGSEEITVWNLAKSYSIFANGGYLIDPYLIKYIQSNHNGLIFDQAMPAIACHNCAQRKELANEDKQTSTEPTDNANDDPNQLTPDQSTPKLALRVVDYKNIWIMNSMLQDVIKYGTGRKARSLQRNDLAGKTGTTNDQRDAWFAGFNTQIVTICWVGHDNFSPLGNQETGSKAALPMWIQYMKTALHNMPTSVLPRPTGLVDIRIDAKTGEKASATNPNAYFEVFRAENAAKLLDPKNPYITPQQYNIPTELF